jgi:hypothetical protein
LQRLPVGRGCSQIGASRAGEVDYHHVANLFAVATGLVSSGAIGSLWALAVDEPPSLRQLEEDDLLTPVRAMVLVASAPTTLIVHSFWYLIDRPWLGVLMLLIGLAWSFIQGVFIMTQFFGVT